MLIYVNCYYLSFMQLYQSMKNEWWILDIYLVTALILDIDHTSFIPILGFVDYLSNQVGIISDLLFACLITINKKIKFDKGMGSKKKIKLAE